MKILKKDIQYINFNIINYDFNNFTLKITEDRKFCAAVSDIKLRKLLYIKFEVIFEVKNCKLTCLLNFSVH